MEIDISFLKSGQWDAWREIETDQDKGIPAPPIQKAAEDDALRVVLPAPDDLTVGTMPLIETIRRRRSRRKYTAEPLSLEELSFLLWSTQGVTKRVGGADARHVLRTVPSGGNRHPFETYLLVNNVESVEAGLYRYLPLEHQLLLLSTAADLVDRIHKGSYDQYVKGSAVTFVWTAIPYRTAWRYSFVSPKIIAQDSGHLCQNLYLAAEAIGAGTCGIGAYDQEKMDAAIGVDGETEFTVYLAPVGKIKG